MDRSGELIALPRDGRPRVSIVVLLSRLDLAEPCLRAIAAAHDDGVPCETILVVGSADPALEALVRERTRGARVVLAGGNAGTVVAWNLAFELVRSDRIALLHEDSAPRPGWLAPLLATLEAGDGRVGAVGSRLLWPDGRLQSRGWVLFRDGESRRLTTEVSADEPTPADNVSTAAMLVDRAAWVRAGGWDERFFPALKGQPDFCLALWERGLAVVSDPRSTVVHGTDATTAPGLGPTRAFAMRIFLAQRNGARLRAKWGPVLDGFTPTPALRFADQAELAAAIADGLARTRARAGRLAAGDTVEDAALPATDRSITGSGDALMAREDSVWVPRPDVAARLAAADAQLERDYLDWLAAEDVRLRELLDERDARLRDLEPELARLRALEPEIAHLRERSATLDRIVAGRWWRLRTALRRVTGR